MLSLHDIDDPEFSFPADFLSIVTPPFEVSGGGLVSSSYSGRGEGGERGGIGGGANDTDNEGTSTSVACHQHDTNEFDSYSHKGNDNCNANDNDDEMRRVGGKFRRFYEMPSSFSAL